MGVAVVGPAGQMSHVSQHLWNRPHPHTSPPCSAEQPAQCPTEGAAVQPLQMPKVGFASSGSEAQGPRVGSGEGISAVPKVALILTKRLFGTEIICASK